MKHKVGVAVGSLVPESSRYETRVHLGWWGGVGFSFLLTVRLILNLGQVIGSGSDAHCSGEEEGRVRSLTHTPFLGY